VFTLYIEFVKNDMIIQWPCLLGVVDVNVCSKCPPREL